MAESCIFPVESDATIRVPIELLVGRLPAKGSEHEHDEEEPADLGQHWPAEALEVVESAPEDVGKGGGDT